MTDPPGPGGAIGPAADPPAADNPAAMRICPGCGAIAPTERTTCVRCKASLAAPLVINDPVTGFWVGVECGFKCRACGHTSPLNFLDVDGDVRCLRCGIEQEFARDQWWDGLEVAHAAGDLTGPVAGGRFPTGRPLASSQLSQKLHQIGIEKTFVESSNRGVVIDGSGVHTRSLLVRALPGHPLCDACKRPLDVTACEHGDLSVRCPGCGDARTYWRPRLPKSLQALAGLVAPELEKGGREAKVDKDASGAAVIACPSCGAPLDIDGTRTVVRCTFCNVSVRNPVGDPARRRPRPPEAGALVAVLHRGVAPAPAARAAGRGERRQGRAPGGATGGPAPLRVDGITPGDDDGAIDAGARGNGLVAVAVFALLAVGVGTAILWKARSGHRPHRSHGSHGSVAHAAPPRDRAPARRPTRRRWSWCGRARSTGPAA